MRLQKYENPDLKADPVVVPTQQLQADEVGISGTILNSDGSAASGTEVNIDGKTVISGLAGNFSFTGKVSNTDKVIVRVSKPGNFKYSKTLVVEANAIYGGLRIYLRPELVAGTFNSASGGTITTTYATLVFQANSFTKEDGTAYQDVVNVKIPINALLEPFNKYPGDGRAPQNQSFYITYQGETAGNFSIYTLALSIPNKNYMMSWRLYTPGTIIVNKYKNGNTLIEGNFKSTVNLNRDFSKTTQLTGTFNITR